MRIGIGFIAGAIIAIVDNISFKGEVSPIVIVAMLIAVTALIGAMWGWKGWKASAITWICIPLAHVIKHLFGLHDTLQPNTYLSILMLAGFTLIISSIGTLSGVLLNRVLNFNTNHRP